MKCLFQNFVFFYACGVLLNFEYFHFNSNSTKKIKKGQTNSEKYHDCT